MTRRRGILFLSTALTAIVMLTLWWRPWDPVYSGRRLSSWLRDFEDDQTEKRGVATIAVKQMGPDIIPRLVPYLRYRKSNKDAFFLSRWWDWFMRGISVKSSAGRPLDLRLEGLAALDALGPAARGALPELERMLEEHPPDPRALYLVARIGDAGVPLLERSLTNTASSESKLLRLEARCCLELIRTRSPVLYPDLESGPDAAHFQRRLCEFNLKVLNAAAKDYQIEHPQIDLSPATRP